MCLRLPALFLLCACLSAFAGFTQPVLSKVWVADQGNGTYKNPVLHADYSDPDAIRVGDDYYMIASSFSDIPGLPILHSKDLVNWSLSGYALTRLAPYDHFARPQHGNGVWAPSIRHHNGEFYIYYPDPDFGIFLIKAKDISGPWTAPVLVEAGKGLIDPCPLWDDDGKVYLVHALAGSRAGIKNLLIMKEMNAEGTRTTTEGVIVFDGHDADPTTEGPKLYKRNGYYYLFAPAGGVPTGWQLALRSRNIYGPYERRVVMDQGATPVNGPHQGAWVTTPKGEDWFLHFQDKEGYGRVVHLQPMRWINDWPVIGDDNDGDGKGNPVLTHKKPAVGATYPKATPPDSDEFNTHQLGWQWQWHANPQAFWHYVDGSRLRLFARPLPDSFRNYWDVPNLLMQKLPAETFTATARVRFKPLAAGEKFGFTMFGQDYAYLSLTRTADRIQLAYTTCLQADKGRPETEKVITTDTSGSYFLRIRVEKDAVCTFSYSSDGVRFTEVGERFQARPGKWVGAKLGFFCTRKGRTNDAGWAEIDWIRFEP